MVDMVVSDCNTKRTMLLRILAALLIDYKNKKSVLDTPPSSSRLKLLLDVLVSSGVLVAVVQVCHPGVKSTKSSCRNSITCCGATVWDIAVKPTISVNKMVTSWCI